MDNIDLFRVRMGEPDTESKHYKAGWGGLVVNVLLVRISPSPTWDFLACFDVLVKDPISGDFL